jgi:TolB-like protein
MAIRLQTLGGIKIFRDDLELTDLPGQRTRCALVVYQAIERTVHRDRLLQVFWGEEGKRHTLDQMLHELRKKLGADWILRESADPVIIGPGVTIDALQFDQAIKRGNYEEAAQLYRGSFLEGVSGRLAEGLDYPDTFLEWVEGKRRHFLERLGECQRNRIQTLTEIGDLAGALAAARHWVRQDAAADEANLFLIRLQARSGMRNEALRQFEEYERRVRSIAAPLPEIVQIANDLRQGKFKDDDLPAEPSATIATLRARTGVVVLPVSDLSEEPQAYFCDGLADEINHALSRVPDVRVVPRASAIAVSRLGVGVAEAARKVGVTHAIEGSVRIKPDRFIIRLSLFEAKNEDCRWQQQFDGVFDPSSSAAELFAVQNRIASEATAAFLEAIGRPTAVGPVSLAGVRRRGETTNPRAQLLYQQGRYEWFKRTPQGLRNALQRFEEALWLDPDFARAHCGIADVLCVMGGYDYAMGRPADVFPQALERAKRAMELDPQLSDAHAALANYLMNYEWEWVRAEKHLERAVEFNPGSSTARQWYSNYLAVMESSDEALLEASRALELDPRSGFLSSSLARHYQIMRQPGQAVEQYQHALTLEPGFPSARCGMAIAMAQDHRLDAALAELETLNGEMPGVPFIQALYAYVLGIAGQDNRARPLIQRLKASSSGGFVPPELVAVDYVALKEFDRALDWLDKAFDARSQAMTLIHVEPMFDPIRDHGRFQALVDKVGASRAAAERRDRRRHALLVSDTMSQSVRSHRVGVADVVTPTLAAESPSRSDRLST